MNNDVPTDALKTFQLSINTFIDCYPKFLTVLSIDFHMSVVADTKYKQDDNESIRKTLPCNVITKHCHTSQKKAVPHHNTSVPVDRVTCDCDCKVLTGISYTNGHPEEHPSQS